MTTTTRHSDKHQTGGTSMKTIVSIVAGAMLVATAGAAAAQQDSVEVTGNAEVICQLPDTWRYVSAAHTGGSSTDFSPGARTWTIPANLVAGPDGMATGGQEVAIRIRGESFCNSAHTITVQSQNGGLVADVAAPPGFANRRVMRYSAHWSNAAAGSNTAPSSIYGGTSRGVDNFTPATPGASLTRSFTVTNTVAPPGYRPFDIRMSMPGAAGQLPTAPLVAGAYSDVITVSIGVAP